MSTKGPHPRHDPFTNISSELVEKKKRLLKNRLASFFFLFLLLFLQRQNRHYHLALKFQNPLYRRVQFSTFFQYPGWYNRCKEIPVKEKI